MAQSALVTGAGSGIGQQTSVALAQAGFDVFICGRRESALADTIAGYEKTQNKNELDKNELNKKEQHKDTGSIIAIPCDVTNPAAVESMMRQISKSHGRLDVVFNNAGSNVPPMPIDELSIEQWNHVINVNLNGAFHIARAAFGLMRHQDPQGGRIINNGSISAHVPRPGSVPYTVSKHAITGLTRTLSLDGRAFNIACGQIDIGNASSAMTEKMGGGVPQADGSIKPEPTMDAQHIADAVVNMATLPLSANVQFMTIMATEMPFIGRG